MTRVAASLWLPTHGPQRYSHTAQYTYKENHERDMRGGVRMTLAPTAVAAVADGQLLALANIAQGPERDPALVVEPVGAVLLREVQQSGSPSSNMDGQPSLAARRAWANLHGPMHGPACIFWASLTPFSLRPLCAAAG